ncbi:lactonase family protein [Kribbella deserti]|uniref:Lactonase family protein n=1 Tax=Kribbella deserti TaxID=1926257 RepID=A0ABV6QFC9_9ACTN
MVTSRRRFLGLTAAAAAAGLTHAEIARAGHRATSTMYVGTYTSQSGGGSGLGLASYDTTTGAITSTGSLTGVADPSFVIRNGRFLYAVNEQTSGGVTAIAIETSGRLRVLNRQSTGGSAPCHLALVAGGKFLLSANYSSGDVAVHPVRSDGSLGSRTHLVKHAGSEPHAHQVLADPAGKFVLAVDLGTDSVYTYTLSTTGRLSLKSQAGFADGAGPRHMAFHPGGRFGYVANELDSTIVVCAYDGTTGRLTPGAVQPTAPAGTTNYPAEVIVSPDGRFVYLTNRGHNSVAIFAVENEGASLRRIATPSCGGNWPRHLAFDPTGKLLFVANQRSNGIASFQVDAQTGLLTPGPTSATPMPVCVLPV